MQSVVSVTGQSALLKATANFVVQVMSNWDSATPKPVDWTCVAEFTVFGIVSTPLASMWLQILENNFPSRRKPVLKNFDAKQANGESENLENRGEKESQSDLIWINIFWKLLLDQTIGRFVINTTFLICCYGARVGNSYLLMQEIQRRSWSLFAASWKIWPWVAMVNFIWIPMSWRVLVASFVGFGWNIFLSLASMKT